MICFNDLWSVVVIAANVTFPCLLFMIEQSKPVKDAERSQIYRKHRAYNHSVCMYSSKISNFYAYIVYTDQAPVTTQKCVCWNQRKRKRTKKMVYPPKMDIFRYKMNVNIYLSFWVSSGTMVKRSPTRPTSAIWKIGASPSIMKIGQLRMR